MADTTDFRNGFTMSLDGELFSIVEFQHVKPGKGNAFVRTQAQKYQDRRRARPHLPLG